MITSAPVSIVELLNATQRKLKLDQNGAINSKRRKRTLEAAGFKRALNRTEAESKTAMKLKIFYGKSPIYSLASIRKVALRYGLLLKRTSKYKGSIPEDLADRIEDFKTRHAPKGRTVLSGTLFQSKNYYILAPSDTFELRNTAMDPVLLYRITDGSFVLVHKWGGDFTTGRYVANLFFRPKSAVPFWICAVGTAIYFYITKLIVWLIRSDYVGWSALSIIGGLIFFVLLCSVVFGVSTMNPELFDKEYSSNDDGDDEGDERKDFDDDLEE